MSSMNNSSSSESEHEPGKLVTIIIFTVLYIIQNIKEGNFSLSCYWILCRKYCG
jgi:hypothetical protein